MPLEILKRIMNGFVCRKDQMMPNVSPAFITKQTISVETINNTDQSFATFTASKTHPPVPKNDVNNADDTKSSISKRP